MVTMVIAMRERQMNSERIVALVGGEGAPNAEIFQRTPSKEPTHLPDNSAPKGPQIVKRWGPGVPLYLLIISIFFLNGCGLHLHRPEDAKLAQAASVAFNDAKLAEALKAEFDAAAEILNEEVGAIQRHSNARRDRLTSAIIGGSTNETSWKLLTDYSNNRLMDLLGEMPSGTNWGNIKKVLDAQNDLYDKFITLRGDYLMYEGIRTSQDPRLDGIGGRLTAEDEGKLADPAKSQYKSYLGQLRKYEDLKKEAHISNFKSGRVGTILRLRQAQEDNLLKANQAATELKSLLQSVTKKRDDEIAKANSHGKSLDEISEALQKAEKQADDAKKIFKTVLDGPSSDLEGLHKKLIATEEIRGQIAELLTAAADAVAGKPPKQPSPANSQKAKLLASVTAIRAGVDGATYPRISDLLLESERLRIEIDRLHGLIALEEERKTLFDLQLTALGQEIKALYRVLQHIASTKPSGVLAEEQSVKTQEAAVTSLMYLVESWSSGRTPAEVIDFLISGIDHRAALHNSSSAFAQWANLIGVPLSKLAAYHESGIKSSDLANLINAAGLSAIAGGVF
jgi:hypothetical protein